MHLYGTPLLHHLQTCWPYPFVIPSSALLGDSMQALGSFVLRSLTGPPISPHPQVSSPCPGVGSLRIRPIMT